MRIRGLGVQGGRCVLLAAALVLAQSCGPASPSPRLSVAERAALEAAGSFGELFREVRRVRLGGEREQPLSIRPLLQAISADGEFVVLDKLNVRNIFRFGPDGEPRGRLGEEGRGPGQYIYPHTLTYDADRDRFLVYDGDLLRVLEFGSDYRFRRLFDLPLYVDSLLVTDGRMFAYSSSEANSDVHSPHIHEFRDDGEVARGFLPRPAAYRPIADTEGGGVVAVGAYLYAITPYEYAISVFTRNGRLVSNAIQDSPFYRPPIPSDDVPGKDEFDRLRNYHALWSHIRQILVVDGLIAVVFAEPGERRVLFDLYDRDLDPVVKDVELPGYLGEVYAAGDSIYLFDDERATVDGVLANPELIQYRLSTTIDGREGGT